MMGGLENDLVNCFEKDTHLLICPKMYVESPDQVINYFEWNPSNTDVYERKLLRNHHPFISFADWQSTYS